MNIKKVKRHKLLKRVKINKMKSFTNEPLSEIIEYLNLTLKSHSKASIEVLNPDLAIRNYAGEEIKLEEVSYKYRSYKSWNDLAEILFCKLLTPLVSSKNQVILTFIKIDKENSFHNDKYKDFEKYGENSTFFRINKNEEPSFYHYYKQALINTKVYEKNSILNLGINKADEFEVIKDLLGEDELLKKQFVGVDFSNSAISYAERRFPFSNMKFFTENIANLDRLNLPKFDLIISIGTLQSSTLDFKQVFMNLVQNYLNPKGSMILGFPNCRWYEGELIHGAKALNYSFSEQSVLLKDIYFCKKYLQQKKFRVSISGKNYIFLSASSIRK